MMIITVTMDWFVYFYWLLEMYVFVRVQELKVQSYYDYHEQLSLNKDCSESEVNKYNDATAIVSGPILTPITKLEPVVTRSELDINAEALFVELQQDLGYIEPTFENGHYEIESYEEAFDYEMVSLAELDQEEEHVEICDNENNEEVRGIEEDCIHLADLEKDDGLVSPKGFESFASAKIQDCKDGPQQWVVTIIGMEENYIHVSDGKRIWVNIGEKVAKLRNGNVLILDIVRIGKEITVQNLVRIDSNATEDYLIPDEEQYFHEHRIAM